MNFRTLIWRSLRFHWRSHLGVVIGAAIGSAALIGALIVGDSVRGSLRERALERLGNVDFALASQDRIFSQNLSDVKLFRRKTEPLPTSRSTIVLRLPGVASRPNSGGVVSRINVIGVEPTIELSNHEIVGGFFGFAPKPYEAKLSAGEVLLNLPLAQELAAHVGDEIILRIRKPSALSGDAPMSPNDKQYAGMRVRVTGILSGGQFGDFSLTSDRVPPRNAFVNLLNLQDFVAAKEGVNIVLESSEIARLPAGLQTSAPQWLRPADYTRGIGVEHGKTLNGLNRALADHLRLVDAQTTLETDASKRTLELKTERIFLDAPMVRSALAADTNAQPILTYLANLITTGTNSAPYSMVTAAGAPWTPAGLGDDEIVLNQWLADDLSARPGDALTLVYFDPESGARLSERTNTFRVHSVVPMQMPWADRTLMPQFPGIEKAETTAEWDTAFPLVHKIRPQDDDYWTEHRGTPKAFITLAAGQKMWANRFGDLTAIRFTVPKNGTPALTSGERGNSKPSSGGASVSDESNATHNNLSLFAPVATNSVDVFRAALEKKILATLKPEDLGLRFEPVREQALKAAEQSQDFGGLFIGFSLFVIVAALLLMAMLFQFSLEQRAAEIGTLLALGFTPKKVRRLFLREGVALALIGGLLGTLGGIGYARAMLHGLTTIWRDAVGVSSLKFFITPQTLVMGLFASTLVAVFTLWLALRKQAKQPARELLVNEARAGSNSGEDTRPTGVRGSRRPWVGMVALVMAVGLVGWTFAKRDMANAGAFFGAGALLLVAGLSFLNSQLKLRSQLSSTLQLPSSSKLAVRGLTRRRSRSVATAAMLGSGTFLIVSIGVFRLDANLDATKHSSGTGGFALIGESTMPVVADLNTKAGRETFALNEADFADVNFVQFRVRAGDEASCLNLNRAQKPRLLGVRSEAMRSRFTFAKGETWALLGNSGREPAPSDASENLSLLTSAPTNEIPAIGDAASIQWAMGKKVGDTLDYVDERGNPFKVRIVGAVANSILQGQLIIDEAEFVKHFPSESGYKYFLIDAPTNRVADVSAKLSRALQDAGLELTPASQRLAQFNAVQNTYLGTFQILGGLGLLLGSAGLGIVVLRNVLERRGELAVLLAVGWQRSAVNLLVLREHLVLLALGLAIGLVAAVVAVLPSLLTPGAEFPWLTLNLTLAAVLVNGVIWTWLAARVALRGELLSALRGE